MQPPVFALVSAFALAGLLPSCRSGAVDRAAVGPLGSVDDVDFEPYLAVAHAIVTHAPKPDAVPPARPGQRAFVTFWSPGHAAVRATGLGPTLLDSVIRASDVVARTAEGGGRVEIDVLTSAEPAAVPTEMRDSVFTIGTQGYLASGDGAAVGFVTPNEIIADKLADLSTEKDQTVPLFADKIRARLAERALVAVPALERMRIARFGVTARVEAAKAGESPLKLIRSAPPQSADVTADQLFGGVRAGADYLARMVDGTGRFTDYDYDPVVDAKVNASEYSLMRHAGATYAIMDAYDELRVPEWRGAAERAVGYLLARAHRTRDGVFVSDDDGEEQEKVGGSGVALMALAKYQAATADLRYLEPMRDLARFIVHQQYPDGHLRDNGDVMAEDPRLKGTKQKTEVFFYTGEAVLGLTRLYALDPIEAWLASARKGADWVIDVRDAHSDLKHQINDHWMSYALNDLYVLTGDKRYADHAFKIAHAIEASEPKPPPVADLAGSFNGQGVIVSSSSRLEALASDIQLARFMGENEGWIHALALRCAAFTYSGQLNEENGYFARNPNRAIGGVRANMLSDDVRIDFDAHSVSAWLRLARELRDPSWGTKK